MPTINDATVVASAYTTSASARPQPLSNGWIVTSNYDSTNKTLYFQVDKRDGQGFKPLCFRTFTGSNWTISVKGNKVYLINNQDVNNANKWLIHYTVIDVPTQTNTDIYSVSNLLYNAGFDAVPSGVSSVIEGNELHVPMSLKHGSYSNSYNIFYAKGTINADGSVTWGAVVQVGTYNNTSINEKNPTITLDKNGSPVIITEYTDTSTPQYLIRRYTYNGSSFSGNILYNGATYAQSSPSAIFVPQSVNGLANGRIWVAWQGSGSAHSGYKVYYSYSDDGGVTWATVMYRNGVNASYAYSVPTITANKNNEIFILSWNSSVDGIAQDKLSNSTWTSSDIRTTGRLPSALYDPTFQFTQPLFIYKDSAKIGFYGTWTTTTISVTQGSIGTKSDRTNVLTYTITTDGTMGTITEKVNGTTIATKNIASGVQTVLGLTQSQWDSIVYGKYISVQTDILPKDSGSWEQGSFNSSLSPIASTSRLRLKTSNLPITSNKSYKVSINTGYKIFLTETDSSNVKIKDSGAFLSNNDIYTTSVNGSKLYFQIMRTDGADIQVSEITSANPSLFFADVTKNTLTVEMGTEKWTYTFDKRLATNDDILSAVKAVQDTNNVFLPSVKAQLGSAIRGKGGTVNDTDSWDAIASAVGGITLSSLGGRNVAVGSLSNISSTSTVDTLIGTVNNLAFAPKSIIFVYQGTVDGNALTAYTIDSYVGGYYWKATDPSNGEKVGLTGINDFLPNGFNYYARRYTTNRTYTGIKYIAIG